MSTVLLTGATGFVGSALLQHFATGGVHEVVAAVRGSGADLPGTSASVEVGELTADTDWQAALSNVDVVVHCAARVHVISGRSIDPLSDFRQVNVEGTLNLARQAAKAGVKRFIFVSSVKVNGESTALGQPFTANDWPAPVDPYGISKREAEDDLRDIAIESDMAVVIIRPPLVYGPGVQANFLSMMRWLYNGIPLPLGAISNKRSLVARPNLVDLIGVCVEHPAAANETFLVSDGEDLSTTDLLRRMGTALGKPARLIPVPMAALKMGAKLIHKPALSQRLCGSLQVDISTTCDLLDWQPPVSVNHGLDNAARYFLENRRC